MEEIKNQNQHLLGLLDQYSSGQQPDFPHDIYLTNQKLLEMQTEIDIRDLRIRELEEELGSQYPSVNLDELEDRIKFLIKLLEKCRNTLEREADKEDYDDRVNESQFTSEFDSFAKEINNAVKCKSLNKSNIL